MQSESRFKLILIGFQRCAVSRESWNWCKWCKWTLHLLFSILLKFNATIINYFCPCSVFYNFSWDKQKGTRNSILRYISLKNRFERFEVFKGQTPKLAPARMVWSPSFMCSLHCLSSHSKFLVVPSWPRKRKFLLLWILCWSCPSSEFCQMHFSFPLTLVSTLCIYIQKILAENSVAQTKSGRR